MGRPRGWANGGNGEAGAAVAWSPIGGAAGAPATVLGGDRARGLHRGRRGGGRRVADGRGPMVPRGWRHAFHHPVPAVRALPVVRRAGGDRDPARSVSGSGRSPAHLSRSPSTISRELRRNAATRGGGLGYGATTAQWHAERQGRRPKTAKLAASE